MNMHYQTDTGRVAWYLRENTGWLREINNQMMELDELSHHLHSIKHEDERDSSCLNDLIRRQYQDSTRLNDAIYLQHTRLIDDKDNERIDDIDALCTQDLLRNRVKENEKKYIDLRCDLMQYISTSF
jgi:hypothetical protein